MKKGILIVISGFSGAGKGTVLKELLTKHEDCYAVSISATTRDMREGEQEGVNYFYKTQETFEQMIAEDAFIEYAQYCGRYYGTPKEYVYEQIEAGKDVILEIEVQGALKVKEKFPDTPILFLTPPSAQELQRRLLGRGRESEEEIARRLKQAEVESAYMPQYDFVIVNDVVEDCAEELHELITKLHTASAARSELIQTIQRELQELNQ